MKKFLARLFGNSKSENFEYAAADVSIVIEEIKKAESRSAIEPGRVIYKFVHNDLDLQLDIEITATYRLIAFWGTEKRYSFSIRCAKGEYNKLQDGIKTALQYLDGERRLADLPKTELVKAHYFAAREN